MKKERSQIIREGQKEIESIKEKHRQKVKEMEVLAERNLHNFKKQKNEARKLNDEKDKLQKLLFESKSMVNNFKKGVILM